MKTLHLYLTRQVLATVVMTVAVFTFVLMLGNVMKEILALLVSRQATLGAVAQAVALLVPFALVFALPMGLLTATLLVFGRFSADNELTAVRAGGVSLVALITPILLVSVALSAVCAVVNMQLAPQCRVAYKKLLFGMGMRRAGAFLPEKTFVKDFAGRIVYVGKVNGAELKDVLIYNLDAAGKVESYVRAAHGTLQVDRSQNKISVQLREAWRVGLLDGRRTAGYAEEWELPDIQMAADSEEQAKISNMTFFQLAEELRELEQRIVAPAPVQKLPNAALQELLREVQQQRDELTLPIKVQMHRQVAFSFACIGFTLVGIPLGIRAHRRETTFGIAAALILVMLYYSFFILGQALETHPAVFPHLILWVPNFIFQAVGTVMLWRANRGV